MNRKRIGFRHIRESKNIRSPTEADWRRWREIRERNDIAERLAGTDCYARTDLDPPPYDDIAIRQHEKDQFERATVLLVEDDEMALLERPDGELVRARIGVPRTRCRREG